MVRILSKKTHLRCAGQLDGTLETCGRTISFTSIVLIGGFIVHITGEFSVNKQLAYLLSSAIFLALLANLILVPALMALFWRKMG